MVCASPRTITQSPEGNKNSKPKCQSWFKEKSHVGLTSPLGGVLQVIEKQKSLSVFNLLLAQVLAIPSLSCSSESSLHNLRLGTCAPLLGFCPWQLLWPDCVLSVRGLSIYRVFWIT